MQARAGCQIDCHPKFRRQQILDPGQIDQRKFAVWLDLDEDIEIAVGASLSPSRRAEVYAVATPRARNAFSRRPISARARCRFINSQYPDSADI